MHDNMMDKARELGRLMGQTTEFKTLQRAREALADDRESVALMNKLAELEGKIGNFLRQGVEPGEAERLEYEQAFSSLQSGSLYQSLVAAQTNFDKLLARVNDEIEKGMEAASQSRIILPS